MSTCPRCDADVVTTDTHCPACATDLRIRGSRSGDLILVLDRGVVQFFKYFSAIFAILLLLGAFYLGFDLRSLIGEMNDTQSELESAKADMEATAKIAAANVEGLKAQTALAEAVFQKAKLELEQKLASSELQVLALRKAVSQAELQAEKIRGTFAETEQIKIRMLAQLEEGAGVTEIEIETKIQPDDRTSVIQSKSSRLWVNGTVLRYAFVDTPDVETASVIESAADEWMKHANIQFVHTDSLADADIRIGFSDGQGTWSFVGRDNLRLAASGDPTMNFGWDITKPGGRITVLHEFGHVLGLVHEHQNPTAREIWDIDEVIAFFSAPPNLWPATRIENNILSSSASYPCSRPFDRTSVMMYAFDAKLFKDKRAIEKPTNISASDKSCIAEMYPFK